MFGLQLACTCGTKLGVIFWTRFGAIPTNHNNDVTKFAAPFWVLSLASFLALGAARLTKFFTGAAELHHFLKLRNGILRQCARHVLKSVSMVGKRTLRS